jgi:hypothetical protein
MLVGIEDSCKALSRIYLWASDMHNDSSMEICIEVLSNWSTRLNWPLGCDCLAKELVIVILHQLMVTLHSGVF